VQILLKPSTILGKIRGLTVSSDLGVLGGPETCSPWPAQDGCMGSELTRRNGSDWADGRDKPSSRQGEVSPA
jgi:hypothetical protein